MSGLCGIANFDGAPVTEGDLQAMMEAARHRGPDGSRCAVRSNAGMGYLSLEITPESIGEIQPVVHEPSGLILAADLRLDNRGELLEALRDTIGEVVRSDRPPTDAELVLAARLKWPQSHAEHLLGDFAYAVYDTNDRSLEFVRDPMGLRALYYRIEAHRVLFGTEAKQILAVPGAEKRICEAAVCAHLAGLHPPSEMAFFHNLAMVVPGEAVIVRAGHATRRRFWEIPAETPVKRGREADLFAGFRDVFLEAVRCRLRSSRAVGLSLSGGLDSCSIASAAGRLIADGDVANRTPFAAFSWAFEELAECDERSVSNAVAEEWKIPLHVVPGDDAWPLSGADMIQPDMDDPLQFYYQEIIDKVVARARELGIGLLLTGERGDAVSGHWVYDYPGLLFSGRIGTLFRELSVHRKAMGRSFTQMVKRDLLHPLLSNAGLRNTPNRRLRHNAIFLRPEFARRAGLEDLLRKPPPDCGIRNEARRLRHHLIFSSMCVRRLTLLERHQATHGLAYADPWSDRRIAEYVISLPQHRVHRYADQKRLTRSGLRDILPRDLRQRPGGESPGDPKPLFNRGVYDRDRERVRDLISNSRAADMGYVDKDVLLGNYEKALVGQAEPYDIWWFLTMEMWLRRHWT